MTTLRHHLRAKLIWLAVVPILAVGWWRYKTIGQTQQRVICHVHVVRDSTRAAPETVSVCIVEERK